MKNIFEEIASRGFDMLEAFMDFQRAIEDLKNDSGEAAPYVEPDMHALGSIGSTGYPMGGLDLSMDPLDCEEDFPGRKFFRLEDLDMEDPAFYTGKEIGIPYAVAVRTHDGQNKLLPIKNGLFAEE